MAAILAQLGGNPFNTPVGQKIEQATDGSLASENWTLNMEICDIINDTDEGPKDAVKAVKKRLQQNAGKNYTVVMYSLIVLETCVKNCGKRFHLLITQKDFVQELVKLIGPKNDPPTAVQEKVLTLIQSWAEAFRANPEMQGVVQVYTDLKQKGIEFPTSDLDSTAPIHTPQRMPQHQKPVASAGGGTMNAGNGGAGGVSSPGAVSGTNSSNAGAGSGRGNSSLTPSQQVKLRSELDVVRGNMRVFGEMLTELTPGKEHPSDLELLRDLHKTCQAMQSRIVELLDKVGNEEVTGELLHVNDELNNLFLRFERFEKKRSVVNQTQSTQQQQPSAESKPLIDLENDGTNSNPNDVQGRISGLSLNSETSSPSVKKTLARVDSQTSNDEFDMLAQSRTLSSEYRKSSVSAESKTDPTTAHSARMQKPQTGASGGQSEETATKELPREQDFDEMERWLQEKPEAEQDPQGSITSTEFDRFLTERAAAADRLPNVSRNHQ